jgi:hypothetical protein
MANYSRNLALLVVPLLGVSACGSSGPNRTAQLLDQRVEMQMAPDIASRRAVVQSLPDGARVTLLDSSLFPNNADTLDNRISDPRANIVEGLLDPSLMRIEVADTSTLPANQRDTRVRNVTEYLRVAEVGASLQPAEPSLATPAASAPAGLTVTITVQCPPRRASWNGYGSGASEPVCD